MPAGCYGWPADVVSLALASSSFFFFFQAEDGIRDWSVTGVPDVCSSDLVTRAYTDDRDDFVVLVLGTHGLVQRFSVASGSWTETAPLARFRLARGALYRLRTTQSGASVDRFDLEVPQ